MLIFAWLAAPLPSSFEEFSFRLENDLIHRPVFIYPQHVVLGYLYPRISQYGR